MRVLLLHNRYQFVGGEESVMQAEKALLEAKGHQVTLIEISNDEIVGIWGKANAAASAVYSIASKQRVSAEIADFRPDIVHVHNFFHYFPHRCMTPVAMLECQWCRHSITIDLAALMQYCCAMVRFVKIALAKGYPGQGLYTLAIAVHAPKALSLLQC